MDGSASCSGGTLSAGEGGTCQLVPLSPSATAYVEVPALSIMGFWLPMATAWAPTERPPSMRDDTPADRLLRRHVSSACTRGWRSGELPSDDAGSDVPLRSAAQVVGTPPDYSNIFGIGMGFDLNDPSGAQQAYNAAAHQIVGFQFTVAGLPPGGARVELPTPATSVATDDSWSFELTADGLVTLYFSQLTPAFPPPVGSTQPPFDPTKLDGIMFHVVTNTAAAIPVSSFRVSCLAAIVCFP
jgi:hypothetical protein